jgi:HEAT repeat protein
MKSFSASARALLGVAFVAALLSTAPAPDAAASVADLDEKKCAFETGLGNGECQHFLKNPLGVTDDPCWCDKCRNAEAANQKHDGRKIPPNWNSTLMEGGNNIDVYLKRHSVAWGITCSACFSNDKPWPDGKNEKEPGTVPAKDWAGKPARVTVLARLDKEKKLFPKTADNVVVAYSSHFYFVTDIEGLKVKMPSGTSRAISTHEWAHLMIERAEFARREYERNLGPMMTELQKPGNPSNNPIVPIAIFFAEKERDFARVGDAYFKAPGNKGLRGAGAKMCGDMCLSGFGWSKEKLPEDHTLTTFMRHHVAHNMLALWGSWQTRAKSIPIWMDEGVACWLTKSIEQFKDDAAFCTGEGAASQPSWNQKGWDREVAKLVNTPGKLRPIQELLDKTVVTELTEDDWHRVWSYCDLCLNEWRGPFVKMLAALRQEKDVAEAFQTNLGINPQQFDDRWRDRVLGKRKTMATLPSDSEGEGENSADAQVRKAIRKETDPKVLSAMIKQLGEIKDRKLVPVVVDVMARNADLPRETALVTLLKLKDPGCREDLWKCGLDHPDGIVRAYTARICGRLGLKDALPKLKSQLEDKTSWYARAEAAVACASMKEVDAMAAMRKMASSDPSEKARVGAMDALAMYHEDAETAVPIIAGLLSHAQWQIRVTATQALGEIGSMEAIEPLIARMEIESGRVREDIYLALKKISRDDLGRKPESWRTWWKRLKENNPNGGLPGRPAPPKEDQPPKPKGPDPNDPHATHDAPPPQYWGLELYSSRIAFVLDTSESMLENFTPDPVAAAKFGLAGGNRDKLDLCKEQITNALTSLDPRTHFNIVAFGTAIRNFNQNPVPATPTNKDDAISFLRSLPGAGETNYYNALKVALDIGAEPDTDPNFKATPDTITFLTDGAPTKGDILDADVILEWYTGLNRYSRVTTHTISFGLTGVDATLLRGMAERNWGKFTLVPEDPNAKKRRR